MQYLPDTSSPRSSSLPTMLQLLSCSAVSRFNLVSSCSSRLTWRTSTGCQENPQDDDVDILFAGGGVLEYLLSCAETSWTLG